MRGFLFLIVTSVILLHAGPGGALDGGFDCAEGADEDLVTAESDTAEPAIPVGDPLS